MISPINQLNIEPETTAFGGNSFNYITSALSVDDDDDLDDDDDIDDDDDLDVEEVEIDEVDGVEDPVIEDADLDDDLDLDEDDDDDEDDVI